MKRYILVLVFLLFIPVVSAITYTSQYPPTQNATYVLGTSISSPLYAAWRGTDPSLSVLHSDQNGSWVSNSGTNQWFHIDLGAGKVIKRIYYEPFHNSGTQTDYGAKNFTFWGTNDVSSFNNMTYTNTTGWTQLTVDATEFNRHNATDTANPTYILVTNTVSYRYYGLLFSTSWGQNYVGFRRVELQQTEDAYFNVTADSVGTTSIRWSWGSGYNISGMWVDNYSVCGYDTLASFVDIIDMASCVNHTIMVNTTAGDSATNTTMTTCGTSDSGIKVVEEVPLPIDIIICSLGLTFIIFGWRKK